jgi:hypothetical protein
MKWGSTPHFSYHQLISRVLRYFARASLVGRPRDARRCLIRQDQKVWITVRDYCWGYPFISCYLEMQSDLPIAVLAFIVVFLSFCSRLFLCRLVSPI